jgi:hypothetical protein
MEGELGVFHADPEVFSGIFGNELGSAEVGGFVGEYGQVPQSGQAQQ